MNPVIGPDVLKGKSQVQAFLDKGNHIARALVLITILKEYFIVKNDQGNYLMNTNLVRYVRI